jgi:hypothetical protein
VETAVAAPEVADPEEASAPTESAE